MTHTESPNIRSLAGRVGGYAVHARHDSKAIAARARAGLDKKFEREVLEAATAKGEVLSNSELARRVEFTRKEHFARLAMKSAKTRAARRPGGAA